MRTPTWGLGELIGMNEDKCVIKNVIKVWYGRSKEIIT